jgi:hypothetical protein
MQTDSTSRSKPLLDWLLASVLVLCIVRLWLMPIGSSFWVDEMGTVFVARYGAAHPSLRAAPQVPESIYYVLPRITESIAGSSEAGYRLWSLLAMGAALFLIARVAAAIIHPQCAWLVVFACLSLRGIDYEAADARPYALGTCVAAAAVLLLIRWFDSGRVRDGAAFAMVAALLWRVHLVFWPFYLVFFVYAMVRLARGATPVAGRQAVMIFVVLGVALLPVASRALALNREAAAHVIAAPPSLGALSRALKLGLIAGACAGAWILCGWRGWRADITADPPPGSRALIVSWWLCQPLCLFAFSWITGNGVFVYRYLYLSLPGAALAATAGAAAAASRAPAVHWKAASLAFGLGVLLFLGNWSQWWPMHHNSDWRGAAHAIQELALGPDVPVVCPSPFIEARPPVWNPNYRLPGFLYSQLAAYPIPGRKYLFPFETSPQAEQFAGKLTDETLVLYGRFLIYGDGINVKFWRDWFSARPELAGWRVNAMGSFGDVGVVLFEAFPAVTTDRFLVEAFK